MVLHVNNSLIRRIFLASRLTIMSLDLCNQSYSIACNTWQHSVTSSYIALWILLTCMHVKMLAILILHILMAIILKYLASYTVQFLTGENIDGFGLAWQSVKIFPFNTGII